MLLTGLLCGILLGFVMQRGRFCITGAFRDMYVTKNNKMFVALFIGDYRAIHRFLPLKRNRCIKCRSG